MILYYDIQYSVTNKDSIPYPLLEAGRTCRSHGRRLSKNESPWRRSGEVAALAGNSPRKFRFRAGRILEVKMKFSV